MSVSEFLRGNLSACHTTNIPSLRALRFTKTQRVAIYKSKKHCHYLKPKQNI
ncbi:hypothetical protein [Helicobacter sp. T3_23-1056]